MTKDTPTADLERECSAIEDALYIARGRAEAEKQLIAAGRDPEPFAGASKDVPRIEEAFKKAHERLNAQRVADTAGEAKRLEAEQATAFALAFDRVRQTHAEERALLDEIASCQHELDSDEPANVRSERRLAQMSPAQLADEKLSMYPSFSNAEKAAIDRRNALRRKITTIQTGLSPLQQERETLCNAFPALREVRA